STSKSLTSFIDDQWNQHIALFMNNHDSYVALLQAIAKVIPGAGGKAGDLSMALENYHKQYGQCYQALRDLATHIDAAAQAMGGGDQQIKSSFQSE
ncbi:MAG TPA: hypothetical protein VH593_03230, partial [Ktedonobacteraceae bacterium]